MEINQNKRKKPLKIILIILLVIITLSLAAIFLVPGVKERIPIIGSGINQRWAQTYYDWILKYKDDEYIKDIKTSKLYFVGLEEHPMMVIDGEADGKNNGIIVYLQATDNKPVGTTGEKDVKLYYDSIYDDFEYFNCWRAEFNKKKYYNCQHLTQFHNFGDNRKPDFFFYDDKTFEIHDMKNIQKKSNTQKNQVLIEIDDNLHKVDFDIHGSDSDIRKAVKEAADNFKDIDQIVNDELKTEAKKKIEENNKKATKNNQNSSSSSSSSSSNGQGSNPCDVIERKKCPSGFQLICSMEWCEKKEYVNKSECNDDLAKKYGTPVKGQTEWSSYYNACIINIEATK